MMVMDGVKKSSIHNLRYETHETLSKLFCICVYVESIVANEMKCSFSGNISQFPKNVMILVVTGILGGR